MNLSLFDHLILNLFSSWSFVESKVEVTDYMMNVLLKYMAHPVSSIRKETYQSVVSVLKVINRMYTWCNVGININSQC